MKKNVILLASLMIFLFTGCEADQGNIQTNQVQQRDQATVLSYQAFRQLFDDMGSQLVIPNAEKVEKSDATNLVAIDRSFSFGTRSILTLNGDQTDQETQERIAYKDVDTGTIILIDLIYLKSYLGNDMVFWPTQALEIYEKEPVLKKYDEAMVSYHNVLVKVSLISKDKPVEFQKKYNTLKAVISYLDTYPLK